MAFPSVQGTPAESSTNTAGTSHTVTLPGSIQAGELLLVFIDKGSTAATFNALAGWSELLDENLGNGIAILYRWADGTEGASITLTSSASTRSACIAYRVAGALNPGTALPTLGTVGTGTSTTPDPGNCNPGVAKDYLWFTLFGGAGEEADDDTWANSPPTNFSSMLQKACGTAGTNLGGKLAVATRQFNGSSLDAGTWSEDVSTAWRAYTVAVHPAFAIQDAAHAQAAESPALTQHNVLAAQDGSHAHAADAPALVQHNVLVLQDAAHGQAADNAVLTAHDPALVIQDAAHVHTADAPGLTQHHILLLADALHGHAAESPVLVQHNVLVVADAAHGHAADGPILTQHNLLAIQDGGHAHTADNLILTASGGGTPTQCVLLS